MTSPNLGLVVEAGFRHHLNSQSIHSVDVFGSFDAACGTLGNVRFELILYRHGRQDALCLGRERSVGIDSATRLRWAPWD